MKQFIITLLIMFTSAVLFSQIRTDGTIEITNENLPYKIKQAKSTAKDDGVWKPLNDYFYNKPYPAIPYTESNYCYDTTGTWQQITTHRYGDTFDYCSVTGNQTFTKERFDFFDTITYYVKKNDKKIPDFRIYYDYHYYDRMQEDSFYYVEYSESWNDVVQKWIPLSKRYQGHFDSTLFVIREVNWASFVNEKWKIDGGYRILREYDEGNLVTIHIIQEWNTQTGEYEAWGKNEYIYDEDNIHIETHMYYPKDDNWELYIKHTDIEYTEWYPNSQESIVLDNDIDEYIGIADKKAKMKSYTIWQLNSNDEWAKTFIHKHEWNLNETKSHIDSMFILFNDIWYPYYMIGHLYDERENYVQKWSEFYEYSDMYGNVMLDRGTKICHHYTYHHIYNELETYHLWEVKYKKDAQLWDSTFIWTWEYFNWHDVSQPMSITEPEAPSVVALSIYPNPVSGVVTISATAEIQQLNVFDITGRLIVSRSPADDKVVFDTGTLPKGVYLVQALLRDGGQRTGKIIKN